MEIPQINDTARKEYIMKMIDEFISKKGNDKNTKTNNPSLENLFENSDLPITPFQLNKIRHLYIDRPEYTFHNKKYYYLSNEILDRDFGVTIGKTNDTKPYEIRFCTFKVIGKCKDPFLQFFFISLLNEFNRFEFSK
jgi:hypothetical protein